MRRGFTLLEGRSSCDREMGTYVAVGPGIGVTGEGNLYCSQAGRNCERESFGEWEKGPGKFKCPRL